MTAYQYPDMVWGETLRPLDVEVFDERAKTVLAFFAAQVSVYRGDLRIINHADALVTPLATKPLWPVLWWDGIAGITAPTRDTVHHVYWHLTREGRTITLRDPFRWVVTPPK